MIIENKPGFSVSPAPISIVGADAGRPSLPPARIVRGHPSTNSGQALRRCSGQVGRSYNRSETTPFLWPFSVVISVVGADAGRPPSPLGSSAVHQEQILVFLKNVPAFDDSRDRIIKPLFPLRKEPLASGVAASHSICLTVHICLSAKRSRQHLLVGRPSSQFHPNSIFWTSSLGKTNLE